MPFSLHSKFKPSGDQPEAIDFLTQGIFAGIKHQTLIGATGTGKTFTMANVIENTQKPTLIIAHNKTLAAQLYSEFKEFFPENCVEYFVSYYDYYQPEAYVPQRDLYIEKDSDINEVIERYRNSATQSLLTRKDVIIISTVSCIYGLGDPVDYVQLSIEIKSGEDFPRQKLLTRLMDIQYERINHDFAPGSFRVRGEFVDIYLVTSADNALRIEFFGDSVESIKTINPLTGEVTGTLENVKIFPAKAYVSPEEKVKSALNEIEEDLQKEVERFDKSGKMFEAARLKQRVNYDLEMLRETGFTKGIENYSRYFEKRPIGSPPSTLIDYYPNDFLMMIDESHITVPQIGGMFNGDLSRKTNLVDYGFRMKSALDNRPLKFEEFKSRQNQTVYVSATPAKYEIELSQKSAKEIL